MKVGKGHWSKTNQQTSSVRRNVEIIGVAHCPKKLYKNKQTKKEEQSKKKKEEMLQIFIPSVNHTP